MMFNVSHTDALKSAYLTLMYGKVKGHLLSENYYDYGWQKVKFTLQQATKAQTWSRGIALLFP